MSDKLRAAAEAALTALKMVALDAKTTPNAYEATRMATVELRAALAEQEDAKPTAWCWATEGVRGMVFHGPGPDADIAARAAAAETPRTVQYLWDGPPPRREWRGLTQEELEAALGLTEYTDLESATNLIVAAHAIEAALKEKNHD